MPFDEARRLAAGVEVELTEHWQPGGLVERHKDYVALRSPLKRGSDRSDQSV